MNKALSLSKKYIFCFLLIFTIVSLNSCSEKNDEWEYKIWKSAGTANEPYGNFTGMEFADPTSQLNIFGKDGWELVSTYTQIQTVHPNFGKEQYVTGLQPNTRTEAIVYVFKRKKQQNAK